MPRRRRALPVVYAEPSQVALEQAAQGALAAGGNRRATFRRRGGDVDAAPPLRPVAWKGLPAGAAPWEQIGVYGDAVQNQFPAYWPGLQLRQGVEGLSSAWLTPAAPVAGAQAIPTFRNQRRGFNAGPQRVGSQYSGPTGPLNANDLYARVGAAQVRQSGLSALAWASQLSDG